jgi:4-amino-4-deoxy-L-arabinose transferase
MDALLSVHVFAALALDMAEPDETGPHRGAAIGALLGLAFLAKGPVGVVLPLLVMLAGRTAAGRNVLPAWRPSVAFLAAWCVVALPWGLAFLRRQGAGEVTGIVRTEVLERYFAGTAHVEPPWYFALVMVVGFSPWIPPLILALIRSFGLRRDPAARTALYAGAGLLAGLLFFSIGLGKRPQYILPLAPLVALLVTWELARELDAPRERRWGPSLLTAWLLSVSVILGAVAAIRPEEAARTTGWIGAIAFLLGALWATAGLLRQRPRQVYGGAAAASALFLLAAAFVLHPAVARDRSTAPLIESVPELKSDRPLVVAEIRLPSLTFYLDRAPETIGYADLEERLLRDDRPYVVLADVDLPDLPVAAAGRLRELGRSGKLIVFEEVGGGGPDGRTTDENAP